MAMKTCCFCFDLKHGTNASAAFVLVTRIIAILILISGLVIIDKASKDPKTSQNPVLQMEITWVNVILGISIGFCTLLSIFSIMLLVGVKQNNRHLFWPWVIMMGVEIGWDVLVVIRGFTILSAGGLYYILVGLIIGLFNIYMLLCVDAYYKQLAKEQPNSNYCSVNEA